MNKIILACILFASLLLTSVSVRASSWYTDIFRLQEKPKTRVTCVNEHMVFEPYLTFLEEDEPARLCKIRVSAPNDGTFETSQSFPNFVGSDQQEAASSDEARASR